MIGTDEMTPLEGFMCLLITCETGGATIPAWFHTQTGLGPVAPSVDNASAGARSGRQEANRSPGIPEPGMRRIAAAADQPARYAASSMAAQLGSQLILNEYSCELIDLTRSLQNRQLFPKLTRGCSQEDRQKLVDLVYRPYRDRVETAIQALFSAHGFAIHLSVRSFNLRSQGKIRRTDVGLLYDPSRDDEVDLCVDWINEMWWRVPMLRVRRNYPRRGTANGLIPSLRQQFAGENYLGVEVWLNRAWARREVAKRDEAISGICSSLQAILEEEADTQTAAA